MPASRPNTKARKRPISYCSSENAAKPSIGRFFKNTKTTSREGNPNAPHFQQMLRDAAARRFDMILLVLKRFHTVARRLRDRREGRTTLELNDEYDVQDLLHGLLKIFFDDIRPEEWTPSYAGKSSKVDFFLKIEGIVIEVKMTRKGLEAKEVGDQLIIDIERYRQMTGCKRLICFVCDPEHRIQNPVGFERDLSRIEGELAVQVAVLPTSF